VEFQTTTPPKPVTRLIAKRNARANHVITFKTTEDAKYKEGGKRRDNECFVLSHK